MAVLSVGPGKPYSTIAAAVAAAQNGDTVEVQAGTYTNQYLSINKNITLQGVGGMVSMVSTGLIPNGKAIFITSGNITIDNFEFSGAQVSDANGAGIRYEGGNLTLNDCYFHNNEDGLLGGTWPTGTLTINNSEFASCLPSTLSWILRYYLPEIAKIFRIEPMPRNRVQHQKGLSDDAFERLYPDEQACRNAWFAWRWPEGFKCPRCAGSTYCEIRGRQLLQCRQCRYQTSLIAGTVLQGTKLPMRVWFRAMHLLAQGKKGLSNIELGRRLGISTNAAWRVQHKLMQAMIERDRRYKLGAGGPRIEIDDAYIGGERTGEGSGRGRRGHTPFIIAVETTANGRPLYARLQVVRGFQTAETKRLCARVEAGTTVVSDGGQWFQCIAWQPGIIHERHVTGSGRTAARHPAFRWANTVLANVKNSLLATHRAVAAKHLPRYLGAFAWRFNRRFVLKTIHERLAIAAAATPPMPHRLLKLAEARW